MLCTMPIFRSWNPKFMSKSRFRSMRSFVARLVDGNWRFDLIVHGERHEGLDVGQAFALLAEAAALMSLGTKKRADWLKRAGSVLHT